MGEIAVRPMIHTEARECVNKINANFANVRSLILELYEREGWSALGYESWRECVTKEFDSSQAYLYRQLEAAQTEKVISPMGEKEIPERQLRPLTKLKDNPSQQREAWQQAVDTAPEGKVTAAIVAKVVKEMTAPVKQTEPIKSKPKEVKNGELISEEFKAAFEELFLEVQKEKLSKWRTTSKEAALKYVNCLIDVITIK
jgi:hypothetical protein